MPVAISLLGDAVDYAGLFPPAARSMEESVAEYASIQAGAEAWALGRFVAPAARLEEFARCLLARPAGDRPWQVSVTAGDDLVGDLARVAELAHRLPARRARVDAIEFRIPVVEALPAALSAIPPELARYAEIPWGSDPVPFVAALQRGESAAKFRTGGVVAEAIPEPEQLLAALQAVVRARVPFKCTAGLHHPVRGLFPLTYEPGGPRAMMHGFLNVLLATAVLQRGESLEMARAILLETDPAAFTLQDEAVRWRDTTFDRVQLWTLRQRGFRAFGSCSFREPVDELAAMTPR